MHVEDRGYQFSDGVYEVCEIHQGRLVDETRHLDRLERSLRELKIRMPMDRKALSHVLREVVRRNRVRHGLVYMQVTRGVSRRDHPFPSPEVQPALVVTAKSIDPAKGVKMAEKGIAVTTAPDNRWERVDIKTVGLLPNVLARQDAQEKGAQEAWLVDADGNVTEGSSTNAWIIKDGALITRHADRGILRGITRTVVVEVLAAEGLRLEERPFSVEEAKKADEAFVTSATKIVMPVVSIDGQAIGGGRPGPLVKRLRGAFRRHSELAAA
ncbi:D-alanine aminotransferase [Lutibaculum baratangense AMV1]|uniref:Probable branched-chain-amino-acid aminotransferase n=1 Tax=Lutibaculum baratangense AMV1 TaxID=631454 RepID=V4RVY5_9HYPH|nr:D-alanine aminotransferase [Lutibaculum baratangense AMV1]